MDRSNLLPLIARLGKEFVRLGMPEQAERLRLYYLAVRRGMTRGRRELQVSLNEDLVVEWLKLLDIPPYRGGYETRPAGASCKTCPPRPALLLTERTFPGGAKLKCQRCQAVWVVRDGPR